MLNPNTFFLSLGAICGSIIIAGGLIAGAVVISDNGSAPSQPQAQNPQGQQNQQQEQKEVSFDIEENDPSLGETDAPVTIVEFSDYGCPFCKKFHEQTFPQIVSDYVETGDVRFVFKHRPVDQLHPTATTRSIAAQCVYSLQGDEAFYDYTKRMFENQDSAGKKETMKTLAEKTGVDAEAFASCLDNKETEEAVTKDNSLAKEQGVRGTPSFAIGTVEDGTFTGKLLVGAQPYSRFQSRIDSLLP